MRLNVHPADPVSYVLVNMAGEFERHNVGAGVVHDCQVIIDEIYANLRAHVLPDNPNLTWTITLNPAEDHLEMVVEYPGPFFDPTRPLPVGYRQPAVRPEGGMGLYLMSELSDDLKHTYHRGVNTLTIRKELGSNYKEHSLCR